MQDDMVKIRNNLAFGNGNDMPSISVYPIISCNLFCCRSEYCEIPMA